MAKKNGVLPLPLWENIRLEPNLPHAHYSLGAYTVLLGNVTALFSRIDERSNCALIPRRTLYSTVAELRDARSGQHLEATAAGGVQAITLVLNRAGRREKPRFGDFLVDAGSRPRPANRLRLVVQGAAPSALLRIDEAAAHGIAERFADLPQHTLERLS